MVCNCTSDDNQEPSASFTRIAVIMSIVIFILGVSANFFIVISFCKVKLLRTVTNYFIVNLAVADIFLLVALAVWMIVEKAILLNDSQKKLASNFLVSIDVFCSSASLTSLGCVSIDRCLAVIVPLRYQSIATHSRALLVVFSVWGYSVLTFVTAYCRRITSLNAYNKIYIFCYFAFSFSLPMVMTTASYYRIFRAVWRQVHHHPKHTNHNRRMRFIMKEFRTAFNILVTILPVYFMWGTFWVITLYETIMDSTPDYPVVIDWFIGNAPNFAAAVNPLIYISMTRDFRLLCLQLLSCKKRANEFSFSAVEVRQRTTSTRSGSTTLSIPLVDVVSSDELARSLTISEDSRMSSSGQQCLSADSSCVTSSPIDERLDFSSSL